MCQHAIFCLKNWNVNSCTNYSKASSCTVFASLKKHVPQKLCIMKLKITPPKNAQKAHKIGENQRKICVSPRSAVKICISQVSLDPNKNCVFKVCSFRGHVSWGLTDFKIQFKWLIHSKSVNYLQISIMGWYLLPWFSTLWST